MKIPFVICLTPFNESDGQIVKMIPYSFAAAPKCYKCKSVANCYLSKDNKTPQWYCSVCKKRNVFTSAHMQTYINMQSESKVFDLPYPQTLNEVMKYSFTQTVFLFVIEVTSDTFYSGFVHTAIQRIRELFINRDVGEVSIFLINSQMHYPTINQQSVSLTTCEDILETDLPPLRKFFFKLDSQKKQFLDFLDFIEGVQPSETSISLIDIMKIIVNFASNINISVSFLVSNLVNGNFQQYKDLSISTLHTMIPFDLFLVDNSKVDFSVLREVNLISNGFFNIYSQTQADLFSNEFVQRIQENRYNEIEILAKLPPELKINDIRGCGVRTSNNVFTLLTMNSHNSVYFYIDFSSSYIPQNSELGFQFQVIYYDNKFKRIVRIINHSVKTYEGFEMLSNHADFDVLVSGCTIQAIDTGRETNNCNNAAKEMISFSENFHTNKFASYFFRNQKTFDIMMIENAFNSSALLSKSVNWPLLSGRQPNDIILFLAPYAYKISRVSTTIIGPLHINEMDFKNCCYYVKLPNKQGVIYLSMNEDLNEWIYGLNYPPLSNTIAQLCQESRIEFIHPVYSQSNPIFQRFLTLKV